MHPFEDGALFERVYDVSTDAQLQFLYGSTAMADVDGDGEEEELSIGAGPTSGIFTFTLTVSENGKAEYFNVFTTEYHILSFVKDKQGKLLLRGESYGESGEVHYFDITVKEGNTVISENGKDMAYWGEQGLTSSWYVRKQG
jgi:hypothetical protein